MRAALLLALSSLCFASEGISLSPGQSLGGNPAGLPTSTPFRVEESLQNVSPTCQTGFRFFSGAGVNDYTICAGSPAVSYLNLCNPTNCFDVPVTNLPSGFVTFRQQHDPVAKADYVQAWDINGNLIFSQELSYSSQNGGTYGNGLEIVQGSQTYPIVVNFARVYTAVVPTNQRPPLATDTTDNLYFEFKFDGNLNDSGPNRFTLSLSTGSATYVPTLGQNVVVPLISYTDVNPSWPAPISGFLPSMRAGEPAHLSCANSYSQSDDPNVTCLWQVLPQPGQLPPIWDDQTSQTPTLAGLVFGDYTIQLTATDASGDTATTAIHVGAVATDDNGVVVNANPAADAILGPMIAFGRNPWGMADYWHLAGSLERYSQYISEGLSPTWPYATWEQPQAGTVSYTWSDSSYQITTLSAACSAAATSCTVTNASGLQLGTLPARIYISNATTNGGAEEIRVCSVAGNTLTFCYDGRGYADSNFNRMAASNWNAGDSVGNMPVVGSGTAFTKVLCPAGAPGPGGTATYSTGTVGLTAGSTTATLSGGAWSASSVAANYYLVVSATHSSTPFQFISPISSLTDSTHLVLSRAFPTDADTASGLTYAIVNPNLSAVLWYGGTLGSQSNLPFSKPWGVYGCESDTLAYTSPWWDSGSYAPPHITTSQNYSYQLNLSTWSNQSSTGGLDFYSEDLANLAGWLRSGLKQFHDSSMMIGDIWSRLPSFNPGGVGSPLFYGGTYIGGFANALLSDTGHETSWNNLRASALAQTLPGFLGVAYPGMSCNGWDSRDWGYLGSLVALAAEFDPDTTSTDAPGGISWHQYWQNALTALKANDAACANQFGGSENSWKESGYGWPGSISAANTVTLTNGSTAGTGSGLSNSFCHGVAQASNVTVTNGSSIVTGTGFPTSGWNRVAITGPGLVNRQGNSVPTLWVYATPNSSTQFTISYGATWPGTASSTASVMFDNGTDYVTTFMANSNDPMSQSAWSCIFNSSSSITLNRPWTGTTGTNYGATNNVTGFAVQPYMLGIRQYSWWQAQQATAVSQPTLSAQFATMRNEAGTYEHNVYDPAAGANYYGIQPACEPITLASMGNSACYSGYPPTGSGAAYSYTAERVNAAENSVSLVDYYLSQNGSGNAVAWGDLMYGNCYGNPLYTQSGYYAATDGNTCDSANGNLNSSTSWGIGAGKWYGFFFGMGASWRWPAVRLGGVQRALPRAIFVEFDLGSVESAASVRVVVTAPSGAQTSYACSTSPCQVTVDDRQGSHVYQMTYLSSCGQELARSRPGLLD